MPSAGRHIEREKNEQTWSIFEIDIIYHEDLNRISQFVLIGAVGGGASGGLTVGFNCQRCGWDLLIDPSDQGIPTQIS